MEGFSSIQASENSVNMKESLELATNRARKILRQMLDGMKLDIPEGAWPEIEVFEISDNLTGAPAFYDSNRNVVAIGLKDIDNGISYGEELGHFIRSYFEKENTEQDSLGLSIKIAVDEFYGRLGENIARNTCTDSELGALFGDKERSHFENGEFNNFVDENLGEQKASLDKLEEILKMNREGKLTIARAIRRFFSLLKEAELLCEEAGENGSPVPELASSIISFVYDRPGGVKDLAKLMETFVRDGGYPDWAGNLLSVLESAKNSLNNLRRTAEDEAFVGRKIVYSYLKSDLENIGSRCDSCLFKLRFSGDNSKIFGLFLKQQSYFYHVVGYSAAEKYMKDNPDWFEGLSKIYKYKDREALAEFIDNEEFRSWLLSNESLRSLAEMGEQLIRVKDLLSLGNEPEFQGLE